jgi:hypothetical protein
MTTNLLPSRSTFWGVAHKDENCSEPTSPDIGRKLKIAPPLLLISTTVKGGRDSLIRH